MSVSLSKGQKISLTKDNSGLKKILVGLGWDPVKKGLFSSKPDIDCDASAIILDTSNKYKGCVYYGNLNEFGVHHHGDNLTGNGAGDDEQITIDLERLDSNVGKIIFTVNIYNCVSRKQDFGMVKNAYVRLDDADSGKELCQYNLSDDYSGKTALIFGEVYRHNGEWKFNAIGQGTSDISVGQLCNLYK